MKKITSLLLALLLIVTSTPAVTFAAGNTLDTVETIDIFTGIQGTINSETNQEEQYFKFYIDKDSVIDLSMTVSDSSLSTNYYIEKRINGIYSNVPGYRYDHSVPNIDHTYYYLPADPNPYILRLKGGYGEEQYSIVANRVDDVSNNLTSPKTTKVNTLTSGTLYTENDVDCYTFNTGKYNIINIDAVAGNWCSPVYSIYTNTSGSDAALVKQWRYNSLGSANESSGYIKLNKNTNYYLKVALWNGDPNTYSFKLKGYVDVANSDKSAQTIKLEKNVSSKLEYVKDVDCYKFKATKTGTMKLSSNCSTGYNAKIAVYRKGSNILLTNDYITKDGNVKKFKVKKGKWYIVRVTNESSSSNPTYKFKVK